jgi:hypothetical protein
VHTQTNAGNSPPGSELTKTKQKQNKNKTKTKQNKNKIFIPEKGAKNTRTYTDPSKN